MAEFLTGNAFFACTLTVLAFLLGQLVQKKWKLAILNPILLAAVGIGIFLTAAKIPNSEYQKGVEFLNFLLTPATISLSVSLYTQVKKLRAHLGAILAGALGGTVSAILLIWAMARGLGLNTTLQYSLLPKSLTTAIGVALSEEMGGIGAVTTAAIIATGILGNITGPFLSKLLKLTDPIAQGVAYGTASHVIGTARAASISELTGAVSSLSLTVAGVFSCVILAFLV